MDIGAISAAYLFTVADGKLESSPTVERDYGSLPDLRELESSPTAVGGHQHDAWQVRLSPAADYVAWLDGDELLVRPLDDPSSHYEHLGPSTGGGVRGFAWAPFGQSLAFWTRDAYYVVDVETLSFSTGLNLSSPRQQSLPVPGEVEAVRWTGIDQLLVTTRAVAPRQAFVRARPLDD